MKPEYTALNAEIIDDLKTILGETYEEMIEEQIVAAREYLAKIQHAFETGDACAGNKLAHALKSSAGQIGLQGVHWLAKDLEMTFMADHDQGAAPSERARQIFSYLTLAFEHSIQALKAYGKAR